MNSEIFNKPWMEHINQDLLVRYWESKGCPGILETRTYGIVMRRVRTPYGVFIGYPHPLFQGNGIRGAHEQ